MAKVLVVDDDENIRALLLQAFFRAGLQVDCAINGSEALEKMQSESFDVVVSDLVMPADALIGTISDFKRRFMSPERNGLDAIAHIKDNFPEAKVVAISGSIPAQADEFLAKAKTMGAAAIFKKPFSVRELVKSVQDLAAGAPPAPKRRALEQ